MLIDIDQKFTFEDIIPIRDLIAETCGLHFDEKKYYFIEKRIAKRIKATNTQSAKDYFRLLKLGQNHDEMKELVASLTTNETYFFRYLPQLESFAEEALPMICSAKRAKNDYNLNIWSAGCSSGEEPYTLNILLREHLKDLSKWNIRILATDIDYQILKKAREGLYEKRAVKDVNPEILEKYFTQIGSRYQICQEIKTGVSFSYANLMDRREMRSINDMDFVFCRNVLIYFDDKARKQVVNSIYNCLLPGGFIFLGHSESVGKISATFKLVKFQKSLSYQK
ncbi:protein-glutamate O-methyltransferase CheR [bacterium]|nr:protein-glutamate O-methyltransferase CheR [bacterium]